MLTDEIASSWKKAMSSIQQNERKEMLTDEQASSSQKALISIQQNGKKCSRADKLLAERKQYRFEIKVQCFCNT